AVFAADMRAGLAAILADRIGQGAARFDGDGVVLAVDGQRDGGFVSHNALSALRSSARMRCGVAGMVSISTLNGVSASLMALSTAAGGPMEPPSPRPLALVID